MLRTAVCHIAAALPARRSIVIRNILIAVLAVIAVILGYRYYHLAADFEKQAQLLTDTRDKATKDLQVVNEKLANEERARQVAEKDAKSVSEKLAEEQALRDKAEQALKSSNERLAEIQNALANVQQIARDAKEAQSKAEKDKEAAQQAAKEAQDALAKEREALGRERTRQKPAGG
jgi:hypothetical protein